MIWFSAIMISSNKCVSLSIPNGRFEWLLSSNIEQFTPPPTYKRLQSIQHLIKSIFEYHVCGFIVRPTSSLCAKLWAEERIDPMIVLSNESFLEWFDFRMISEIVISFTGAIKWPQWSQICICNTCNVYRYSLLLLSQIGK